MKVSIILGTRPEIIKFSPILRELEALGLDYFVLHSGQHYSFNMDAVFFEQLALPRAKYNLNVGSRSHAEQTGKMLIGIESVLQKESPHIVLVEGDTNTVLAGALAAVKLGIPVGHVEAGLRSYDRTMPEEINRILTDHCADLLFAPTTTSKTILLREGIAENTVFVTGNPIVDAIQKNLALSKSKPNVLDVFDLDPDAYFLATVHRQGNVDDATRFTEIMRGLMRLQQEFACPVVYPIHPRAEKELRRLDVTVQGITLTEPLDYFSFLQLERHAKLILTDSGGVQEEACVLQVPCVTLRDNTERPETLAVGSNVLAGTDPATIVEASRMMVAKRRTWANPFGDGKAGARIVRILRERFESTYA
jgi:UDP-N-acetylglucosamine 2-epimerase (non-hydrolysing)